MARPKPPLFLAKVPYRRRRLRDAARLLPVVGILLVLAPLLWTPEGQVRLSARDVGYFFAVWLILIGAAAGFAPGLRGDRAEEEED